MASETSTLSTSFLISMLQWLAGNDDGDDGAGVCPICFEEVALLLANQPCFGFPFWNPAIQSMDIFPLCSRCTKPTLA